MVLPYIFRISFAHCIPESRDENVFLQKTIQSSHIVQEKKSEGIVLERNQKKFIKNLRTFLTKEKFPQVSEVNFLQRKNPQDTGNYFF